jgi:hypothetical protein
MKWLLAIFLIIAAFGIGAGVGYTSGRRSARFSSALNENMVAFANLSGDRIFYGGTNLPPQLREYLKARIYCNIYSYYPNDRASLLKEDWDFGSVDRQVLGDISVWHDLDQRVWDWSSAITSK